MNNISEKLRNKLTGYQLNEITEFHIYRKLAGLVKSAGNREVLEKISREEKRHYEIWKKYTGQDVKPDRLKILKYVVISRLFGFTFAVKLMEAGEQNAQNEYSEISATINEAGAIAEDEDRHEDELVELLDEERLRYTGSIVLGLNDALVELTGALAGLTLALRNVRLIALTGAITGIAAAMSMAASEYLSIKSEGKDADKNPLKASVYTGLAYVLTVIVLVGPYFFISNHYICLVVALVSALVIIALFNYYLAVAKGLPFRSRFLEMAGLSLGIAALSFGIGYLLRRWMGV